MSKPCELRMVIERVGGLEVDLVRSNLVLKGENLGEFEF